MEGAKDKWDISHVIFMGDLPLSLLALQLIIDVFSGNLIIIEIVISSVVSSSVVTDSWGVDTAEVVGCDGKIIWISFV